MKSLPNISLDKIQALSMDEAAGYKNRFISYEQTKDNKVILTFFINPYQSYTRHKQAATKKIKELFNRGMIQTNTETVYYQGTNHELNNLIKYEYQL